MDNLESIEFERAMVDALADIIEKRGLKHKPIAEKAWPYKKAAFRTWQAMRNGESPQKLTIRDAHSMAMALDITMTTLCGLVEGRLLMSGPEKTGASAACPAHAVKTAKGM